jgi:hypothetical protein
MPLAKLRECSGLYRNTTMSAVGAHMNGPPSVVLQEHGTARAAWQNLNPIGNIVRV